MDLEPRFEVCASGKLECDVVAGLRHTKPLHRACPVEDTEYKRSALSSHNCQTEVGLR